MQEACQHSGGGDQFLCQRLPCCGFMRQYDRPEFETPSFKGAKGPKPESKPGSGRSMAHSRSHSTLPPKVLYTV